MSKRIEASVASGMVRPQWLPAFPAFAAIRDEVWLEAVRAAREIVVPPGTTVIRRGTPCENFYLITQGTIRVYESSEGGREIALFRTSGGEPCILTLNALLAGSHYTADAKSDDEARIVAITVAHFRKVMSGSETFRNIVMARLACRLGDIMGVVEQVTFQHLDLRLACLLGQLFERNQSSGISTTHEELALELGTTRVVVSRMLKEFERMGCIRLKFRQIELVSPKVLAGLGGNRVA